MVTGGLDFPGERQTRSGADGGMEAIYSSYVLRPSARSSSPIFRRSSRSPERSPLPTVHGGLCRSVDCGASTLIPIQMPASFAAGFAERDITPPVGIAMTGFAARGAASSGVRDSLFVRALALISDVQRVVLVGIDVLALSRESVERIRDATSTSVSAASSSMDGYFVRPADATHPPGSACTPPP